MTRVIKDTIVTPKSPSEILNKGDEMLAGSEEKAAVAILFDVTDRICMRIDEAWLKESNESIRTLLSDCRMLIDILRGRVEI